MQAEEERKRPHMRPRTGNGDRRVVSDASRAENFGYGRDLRSLTRWQWSVMVTGERPTIRRDASFGPSPAIISTVTYAHVVHVLAIYRLPRELRLGESEGKYVSLTEESHDAGERRARCIVRALATGCDRNSAVAIRMRGDSRRFYFSLLFHACPILPHFFFYL